MRLMDERLTDADSDRAASPKEPNGYDLIAGLLEFTAAAVIGYGYYRFFFPPPNVRSYGAMDCLWRCDSGLCAGPFG